MLDRELSCLAQKYRCHYSRYADDLTFSTNLNEFPAELGYVEIIGEKKFYRVGNEIQKIITKSGFLVNEGKVTLCGRDTRQIVTGIVVNDKLNVKREYVRQVRSILHSWNKNGFDQTAQYYFENIDKKNRPKGNTDVDFARVVRGKIQYIGLVKGWDNPTFSKLASDLMALDSDFKSKKFKHQHKKDVLCNVYTEGKTDVIHLETALKALQAMGEFTNLEVSFAKSEASKSGGDDFLIKYCRTLKAHMHDVTNIVIGDRDSALNIKELTNKEGFKEWGNNVYSFLVPIPPHRFDSEFVCIEMLYPDDVLKRKDKNGRRLYLTTEFNSKTTKHLTEACVCSYLSTKKLIVETEIYPLDNDDTNLRLSKYDFAINIANNIEPFTNIDFSAFIEVFNKIAEIVNDSNTKYKI